MSLGNFLATFGVAFPTMIAAIAVIVWQRTSRLAWIGGGLVALLMPGMLLTWHLRTTGFDAFGTPCMGDARGFMEAMQWVIAAQGVAGVAGSLVLAIVATRRNQMVGGLLRLPLVISAMISGAWLYFVAGMTAVDGHAC